MKADLFIYLVASLVTWFLTGLWHGANYTFIVWGMIHGFFLILYQAQKQPRKAFFKKIGMKNSNIFVVFFETLFTLIIVLVAWIFFRSDTISQGFAFLGHIFSPSLFDLPSGFFKTGVIWGLVLIVAEWIQRDKQHALQLDKLPVYVRWAAYYILLFLIFNMGGKQETFIYFQF
jgi:alginate O-acetyltransferase complex protein AlgI